MSGVYELILEFNKDEEVMENLERINPDVHRGHGWNLHQTSQESQIKNETFSGKTKDCQN